MSNNKNKTRKLCLGRVAHSITRMVTREAFYKINGNYNLQAGSLAWVITESFDGGASLNLPSPNTDYEFLMTFIFVTISFEFVGLFVF